MNSNEVVNSYSAIAGEYDGEGNQTSFWETRAHSFYESLTLKPSYRVIVDVGCGTGVALRSLGARAPAMTTLIGVEPADDMRALALCGIGANERSRWEVRRPPARRCVRRLPVRIGAFHWVTDPERAAHELRRVLKNTGDMDLLFTWINTGGEFSRQVSDVLGRYVDLGSRLRAAAMKASFDRRLVEQLFSFLPAPGLTISEDTFTHYDTLEAHWAWQVRSEAHYSVVAHQDRAAFDADLKGITAVDVRSLQIG